MGVLGLWEGNLEQRPKDKIKVLLFTEGTILGPRRIIEWFSVTKYVPIKNCVDKIRNWERQGAEINYLTSRRKLKDVKRIREILLANHFPGENLYYRERKEKYKDIAERVLPTILIEDDCRSIGGKWQMTITYVQEEVKAKINSIVVKEFSGIDHLPGNLTDLLNYKK